MWLVPFFQAGWSGRAYSRLPRAVTFQYNAAGLFTRRSNEWWDHHIELQFRDGSRRELAERSVFAMGAFGYRTRLDRILNEGYRRAKREKLLDHLGGFIANAVSARDSVPLASGGAIIASEDIVAIRIVRAVWKVGDPRLAQPEGHWNPPPVHELPASQRRVLGAWRLQDGAAVRLESPSPGAPGEQKPGSVTRRPIVLPGSASENSPPDSLPPAPRGDKAP